MGVIQLEECLPSKQDVNMTKRLEIEFIENNRGCHICTSHKPDNRGYPRLQRDRKSQHVHRYLYKKYFGTIHSRVVIRHTCDNPLCINIRHLIPGTHADNAKDRVKRSRSAYGEKNGRSVLDVEKVKFIRSSDKSIHELARMFKVDRKTIRLVKQKVNWKHVV